MLTQDVIWTLIQRFFERYGRQINGKTALCAYWDITKEYLQKRLLYGEISIAFIIHLSLIQKTTHYFF